MPLPMDALSDETYPPDLQPAVEAYTDQGGLLGAVTYALVVLETDDEHLASELASIPTNLFVTSSLHDDAIDEADRWDDRKRRLNEHVTAGDLVFTNVLEAAHSLPPAVDLAPVLETVREIGGGQLTEEAVDPQTATLEDAVGRVDARGAVWGDLAVALVDAVGGYSDEQLAALGRLATNAMFVLTVVDDVEDLPEDIDNGVATLPIALYDGGLTAFDSSIAAVDAFLASEAPERLEALMADRRAALEDNASAFAESLDRPETDILEATRRGLSWYAESVCSIPLEQTVPRDQHRELLERLSGADEPKRRALEAAIADYPADLSAVDTRSLVDAAVDLPADPLADVIVLTTHATAVVECVMNTSLQAALETLEQRASTPLSGSR